MMNKIKQKIDIIRKVWKLKKIVKNDFYSLYKNAVSGDSYVELELKKGGKITISDYGYREILDYYYSGTIIDINPDKIKVRVNGKEHFIPVDNLSYYSISVLFLRIDSGWEYKENYWERKKVKVRHIYYSIIEVFENKKWKFLNVKGKNVLDIGAFVGDSPIYFILKGAKKVYAIEPHPDVYNEMIENIKLNNMEDKIIPINMGISYEKDYVTINTKKINEIERSLFKSEGDGIKVLAGKLSDIIDKYNIDAQILKMDCEGCEYDIILKDYDTIKEFDEIGFEYHAYNTKISVNKLLDKLKKDFEYKIINCWAERNAGIIYCIRKK